MLRLRDLLPIVDAASERAGRTLQLVAEIKHASYFASIGLPLDEFFAAEIAGWASRDRLIVEAFEQTVLHGIRDRGIPARYVYLAESSGSPADLVARHGPEALSYAAHLTDTGLARLAAEVDGISVEKKLLLATDAAGRVTGTTDLVSRAQAVGLAVYTWTLRAENRFLAESFRRGEIPASTSATGRASSTLSWHPASTGSSPTSPTSCSPLWVTPGERRLDRS